MTAHLLRQRTNVYCNGQNITNNKTMLNIQTLKIPLIEECDERYGI